MNLSNVSDNVINKSLFCRIEPRQYSTFVSHSGNIKKINTTEFLRGIEFDTSEGIIATRKYNLSDLNSNGDWFWDRDNFYLYFYYTGSKTEIVLKLGLFITTTFDLLGPSDPDDQSNNDRIVYEGRFIETSFMQSCEDVLNGKLGINSTNINIINNDSRYNKYATDNVSFKNADIKVWIVINEFSNRVIIFNGLCQNAFFNGSNLSLDVIESTKAFQQDATFSDSKNYFTINATKWPDSKEENRYKIIPMYLSCFSNKTAKKIRGAFWNLLVTPQTIYSEFDYYDCDSENDLPMFYIGSQSSGGGFPQGRKYVVCRVPANQFTENHHILTQNAGNNPINAPILLDNIVNADIEIVRTITISTVNYYAEFSIEAKSTNVNYFKRFYSGMNIFLYDSTSNIYHEMTVTFVDIDKNKFGIRFTNLLAHSTNIKALNHNYVLRYRGPTVYVLNNNVPCQLQYNQYYFTSEQTDGGNYIIYCIISDQYSPLYYEYYSSNAINQYKLYDTAFTPSSISDIPDLEYYCRFLLFETGTNNLSSFDISKALTFTNRRVKELSTDSTSDDPSNGSSYKDFQTKIGTDSFIDIISPENTSQTNDSYLGVVEKILSSTMSFLCLDSNGKIIVRLFEKEPFNSIILELTEDDIKDGTITSDIDFTDIASTIEANPKFAIGPLSISESERIRRICGDIRFNLPHYLKTTSDYESFVKDRINSYKQYPIKRYTFTIINKGYELTLGDRIKLRFDNSGKWLGSDTEKELFIIKLNKSLNGVLVSCIENNFA